MCGLHETTHESLVISLYLHEFLGEYVSQKKMQVLNKISDGVPSNIQQLCCVLIGCIFNGTVEITTFLGKVYQIINNNYSLSVEQ